MNPSVDVVVGQGHAFFQHVLGRWAVENERQTIARFCSGDACYAGHVVPVLVQVFGQTPARCTRARVLHVAYIINRRTGGSQRNHNALAVGFLGVNKVGNFSNDSVNIRCFTLAFGFGSPKDMCALFSDGLHDLIGYGVVG